MANPSKAKGSKFEKDVAAYLIVAGNIDVERRALEGVNDRGDIAGLRGVVLECKAEKAIDLPGYMREVDAEVANAGATFGAAVVKARGKATGDAYVVMSLRRFTYDVLPLLLAATEAERAAA